MWLRKGDGAKLRGALKSLSLPVFDDNRIAPERYVVRAISNVKLCYFGEAQKDLQKFLSDNTRWASAADTALKGRSPQRPPEPDWYTQLVEKAMAKREAEKAELSALGGYWELTEESKLMTEIERLTDQRDREYRRQWRNYAFEIHQAIERLRFVKLDLMSALDQGLSQHSGDGERGGLREK